MDTLSYGMMRGRLLSLYILIILGLLHPPQLHAGVTGKISGSIDRQESGDPLVGATLQIVGTNFGRISDEQGRFVILNIPPGIYTLRISFIGYETMVLGDVPVAADLTTWFKLSLKPSVLEGQEVIVHASEDVIDKDLAGTRSAVTQEDFNSLPITQMVDALTLQSGVVNTNNYLYVRGGRSNQVAYLIDGVYVQDPLLGVFANDLGTNTIQELSLLSGTFNAEYGNAMSGIVNIVTREGGRSWKSRIESRTGIFQNANSNKSEGQKTTWNLGGPLLGDYLRVFVSGQHVNKDSYKPWGFNDENSYTSKLTYTGIANMKINGMYRDSWKRYKYYNHRWKYIPEQYYQYESTRRHLNLNLTHSLSENLFYELRVSQYEQNYRKGIWNDSTSTWKDSSEYLPYSTYQYYTPGGNGREFYARRDPPQYTITATRTFDFRGDIIWQMNTSNELKVGFQYKGHDLDMQNPYDPQSDNPYRDEYHLKPVEMAGYIQDKIEFPFIVINLGIRFDHMDGKVSYRRNPLVEATRTMSTSKSQISPRLGIAHPISDKTKVHFAWGHFFQNPPYAYLYNRLNYDVTVSDPVFGDPDMEPEKTIAYEIGLTHQFTASLQGRFNAYFKDITNLVGTRYFAPFAEDDPDRYAGYTLIINEDYAFSKGFEINLDYKPAPFFSSSMTYTYSIAKGNASFADEQYLSGTESSLLYNLDYDRTHGLNVYGSLKVGKSRGLRVFNSFPFSRTDLGFVFRASSGRPYTPTGKGIGLVEINSLRKPSTYSLDMIAGKRISLPGKLSARAFLEVQNLTNARNVRYIFTSTGEPDYTLTPGHSEEYMHNPSNFGPPRTFRFGLTLDWR